MTRPDQLAPLLLSGESQTLELKASFDRATVKSLVAFANVKGGSVLVGDKDSVDILGVALGKETLNAWLGQIKSATNPALVPDMESEVVKGKTIVVIRVSEFPVKPVSTRGGSFQQVTGPNHQLGLCEISDMHMQSLQLSWDAYVAPNTDIDALARPKIKVVGGESRKLTEPRGVESSVDILDLITRKLRTTQRSWRKCLV